MAVYYVALLRFIGCTSDASETAVLAGGDDVAFNAAMAPMLAASPGEGMRYFVRHLAEDLPLRRRAEQPDAFATTVSVFAAELDRRAATPTR